MKYRRKDILEGRADEAVGVGLDTMSVALDPAEMRAPTVAKSRRESTVQLTMEVSDGDSIAIRRHHTRCRGSSRRISDETTTDGR